jgi:hypothetical protein
LESRRSARDGTTLLRWYAVNRLAASNRENRRA